MSKKMRRGEFSLGREMWRKPRPIENCNNLFQLHLNVEERIAGENGFEGFFLFSTKKLFY